jgi:peptidoglycan biosynthesis protein MviN/MurJ (putative lipid II flippase)
VLGLGLAFGIAYLISSVMALVVLSVRHNAVNWPSLASLTIRAVSAVAAMGIVVALIETAISPQSGLGYVCEVLLAGFAGTATYVVLAVVFGVPEIRQIRRVFVRRNNQANDVYL